MAENKGIDYEELQSQEDSFVWDEKTRLYFHASSGFYHDPNAGWYYSSRDGLYYKYENGEYVLLEIDKVDERQINTLEEGVSDVTSGDVPCRKVSHDCRENDFSFKAVEGFSFEEIEDEGHQHVATVHGESSSERAECSSGQEIKNPPPPSEWLEDTLIDLYLSGYNLQPNHAGDAVVPLEPDDQNKPAFSANGVDNGEELEEGEWIPEDDFDFAALSERELEEGYSRDEENWQAQYGHVIQSSGEAIPDIAATDLWDWKMILEPRKDGKGQVARLVGRLVKLSAKLHPSVSSKGTLLKTAPICEARLHLVRVKTGQVYRLRNPSAKYLQSLSTYDSSNPTKDWGFPDISVTWQRPGQMSKQKNAKEKSGCKDSAKLHHEQHAPVMQKGSAYRDRAAERRNLHGGFGVGPGQKRATASDDGERSSPETISAEEAAAQSLYMSFGSNSYARRILGTMGWKEGEALGKTTKGLTEPLQAVGNVGNAGLGYPRGRTK